MTASAEAATTPRESLFCPRQGENCYVVSAVERTKTNSLKQRSGCTACSVATRNLQVKNAEKNKGTNATSNSLVRRGLEGQASLSDFDGAVEVVFRRVLQL